MFVTYDFDEALCLANRIAIMKDRFCQSKSSLSIKLVEDKVINLLILQ